MNTVDQLEKVGRFVLWIAIAIVFALVPIGIYGRDKQAAKDAEQARADRARDKAELAKEKTADEEAKKPKRIALTSLGGVMRALDGSIGYAWFSNASAREGVVCIQGTAVAPSGQTAESLATCKHVDAYETNIKTSVMFAGGEVKTMCAAAPCQLQLKDFAGEAPAAVAAAR